MGLLARRASRGEARARREEEFLASVFQAATPEGSKGENVTARQLLDQAAGRIDTELASDPQLRAAMAGNIGESYVALGLYDQAQPLLERAVQLTGEAQGQSSADYVLYLSKLAQDYRLRSEFQQAEPLFRRAVAINEKLYGPKSIQYAHSLSDLGDCLYWLDKDAEAEQVLRRALAIERPLPDSVQDGTRSYLALVLERKGAYPEAGQLLREATDITARVYGRQNGDYLIALHNLAGTQIDMGDLDGALKSDQEVLDTRRRIWGPDHPDTAYSLNNLGWIYLEQGRWQNAEPLLQKNLEITRKLDNASGPRYVSALANWGRVLQQKGDFEGAAKTFDQAQYILALGGRTESWSTAKILVYQSLLEMDRRNIPEAIRLATRAVSMQRKLGGDDSPQLATGLLTLGLGELLAGDSGAAESSFRAALAIRQRTYPPTHPEVLLAQVRLAEALLAEKHPDQAFAIAQAALASAKAAPFPLLPWRVAELQNVEALALREMGRGTEAAPLLAANLPALRDYNHAALKNYLLTVVAMPASTTEMAKAR
jgi:tetratricopeptide (TPR) repeat protein